MPTQGQVSELLDLGHTYETAARALDVPAGLAFMIATGLPADGGGAAAAPEAVAPKSVLAGSAQDLVNPPLFGPERRRAVLAWVQARAARELGGGCGA